MWYDPEYRAYVACAVDSQKNFTALGLDFRYESEGKVLPGVYPEVRLCENDDEAVVEMAQRVLDRLERHNPGLKCKEVVYLALSGLQIGESCESAREKAEWLLALKLQVKRVFLVPERRAQNLAKRSPALTAYMAKELRYEDQGDIRRSCCGALLAVIVDAQEPLPEDSRFWAEAAYRTHIKEKRYRVAGYMTDWLYTRFFTGLSSWERHAGEEGSFRALWARILRFMSTHEYEDYTELDDVYQKYFKVCRDHFMEKIWDSMVDEELGCDERTSQEYFEIFRKESAGLLSPQRFDGVKLADFIRFITQRELEKVMEWSGLGMDEPIPAEMVRQIVSRMDGEEYRGEVKADFANFADWHAEQTWSRHVEAERFLDEILQSVRLARDVFFDRFPPEENSKKPYSLFLDDDFLFRRYNDHIEIIEYVGDIGKAVVFPAELYELPVLKVDLQKPIYGSCREFRVEKGVKEVRADFGKCYNIETLEIPESTKVYAQPHAGFSFREHSFLKKGDLIADGTLYAGGIDAWNNPDFVIPADVHEIEYKACSRFEVKNLVVPGSVEIIGEAAFMDCPYLETVRIQEGVILIKRLAFSGCPKLKAISIPASVLEVGDAALGNCRELQKIEIAGDNWKNWDLSDVIMSGIEVVANGYEQYKKEWLAHRAEEENNECIFS